MRRFITEIFWVVRPEKCNIGKIKKIFSQNLGCFNILGIGSLVAFNSQDIYFHELDIL